MRKKAILIIDMLNDFILPIKEERKTKEIIENIKDLINISRKNNDLIIYVNDAHILNEDEELKEWGNHAIKGTNGAKIIKELEPIDNDLIIEKRTFSGFHKTNLESVLHKNNINEIFLCGVFADICLKHTAIDAINKNIKVWFLKDCTIPYSKINIDELVNELKKKGDVALTTFYSI